MSEQDEQVAEATISDEELELELETGDADGVETQEKTYSESEFKQVLARAKNAEAKLKATQPKPAEATQNINQNVLSEETIEIKILQAAGKSQDEIDYLKKLARVNGTGLIAAQHDEMFTTFVSKKEAESKAQKAKLGASRGSGSVKTEKSINSPGLTDAEHKEMWRQQNGR